MHNYRMLGIDLDNVPDYKLLMYYFNLKYSFPDKNIAVFRTSKGYHIIVEGVNTDLKLREIFGDDLWRIKFEEARSKALNREPIDVLFHKKVVYRNGKKVKEFERYPVDLLSLRFKNSRMVTKNV